MDTCYRCGHEKLFHQRGECRKRLLIGGYGFPLTWSQFGLPFYQYEKLTTKSCGCIKFVEGYYGGRERYGNGIRRRPLYPLFREKKRPHRNDNRKQGKIREVKR